MKNIKSIYYHNPEPDGFGRMIEYYKNRGYRFISIEDLYVVLSKGHINNERLAFISIDDGWNGNLNLIPIIEKFNVPICIFVATEPLESGNYWWQYVMKEIGYKGMFEFKKLPYDEFYSRLNDIKQRNSLVRSSMTKEEIVAISKHPLVSIQSHTVNHPILTSSPDDILEKELAESKKKLEELTGKEVFAFSYPNGSLTYREVEACKKYYKIAFTTEQNHIALGSDLYLLPRYALTGHFFRDLLKVMGIWKFFKK